MTTGRDTTTPSLYRRRLEVVAGTIEDFIAQCEDEDELDILLTMQRGIEWLRSRHP